MLNATIDPRLFAPPFGTPTSTLVHHYVSTLLHWTSVQGSSHACVFVTRGTQGALILSNLYPLRPWLRNLLLQTGVVQYDANTVARLAETLLERSSELEHVTGVADLLIESLEMEPNIFSTEDSKELRAESEKAAVILAILRTCTSDPSSANFFLVVNSEAPARVLSVRCRLPLVEHSRSDLEGLPTPPEFFHGGAVLGHTLNDCILALDEVKIWRTAACPQDSMTAIKVAICKSRNSRALAADWGALPNFQLNAGFFATAKTCGVTSNDSLAKSTLRSIVETIEDLKLADTHPIRCGIGPNEPDKTRGADRAMRRDIDDQFHLHYWQCPDGAKEIACVVPHNDLYICA